MKLGNIGVNENVTYSGITIQLLDDGGATAKVETKDLGELDAMFWYLPAEFANDMGVAVGWYLADDVDCTECQNDRVIPFGQGIMVDCGDEGAALVFAGQVTKEDTEIALDYNFNYTGNCSPIDITLGDISVNANVTYSGITIQLLDDGGATAKVETNELGELDAMFWYLPEEFATDMGVAVGWYLADDVDCTECQNSRVLKAGQGIMIDCGDDGAAITIPAAL